MYAHKKYKTQNKNLYEFICMRNRRYLCTFIVVKRTTTQWNIQQGIVKQKIDTFKHRKENDGEREAEKEKERAKTKTMKQVYIIVVVLSR